MDRDSTHNPPPPAVVTLLASRLRALLGDQLVGIYLGGSFAMQDFAPATSDYDVLIVTSRDLTDAQLDGLERLHTTLLRDDPDARRLEGDYAPQDQLIPQGTRNPVPGIRDGQFIRSPEEVMISADNIACMYYWGINVYGPPAKDVLPCATPADVRAAVSAMLAETSADEPTEQDAATAVLNIARSPFSLTSGMPATKTSGAAWATAHLPERYASHLQRALAIRNGAAVEPDDRTLRTELQDLLSHAQVIARRWPRG